MYKRRRVSYAAAAPPMKRRRTGPYRGWGRRRGSAGMTRTSSLYTRRFLASSGDRKPERKFKTLESTIPANQNILTTPAVGYLPLVAQGTQAWERIGSRISIEEASVKAEVVRMGSETGDTTPTNAAVPQSCRAVLVLDKQANGSLPAWSDVFDMSAQGTTDPTRAFLKVENSRRFTILKDVTHLLGSKQCVFNAEAIPDTMFYTGDKWFINWRYKFKRPLVIEYGGTAGTSGEIKSNNILLMYAVDWHDSNIQGPVINTTTNIRYTDM